MAISDQLDARIVGDGLIEGEVTFDAPVTLTYPRVETDAFQAAAKRLIDIIIAASVLIVLAPLWLLVALLVRLDSPGPALYRQTRVGKDGVNFRMFKWRTMERGAHARRAELRHQVGPHGDELFKLMQDPRVTRMGRILRATCLDEIPQLWHVLTGAMSLVGPRPLVPEEDSLIHAVHRGRLAVRPGMTGPWQVSDPPRPPMSVMLQMDNDYVQHWSLGGDVRILARTAGHVLSRRGI